MVEPAVSLLDPLTLEQPPARWHRRLGSALHGALPGWSAGLLGATIWGVCMGASAALRLTFEGWQTTESVREVVLLYAAGGAVGFVPGFMAAALLAGRRGPETRFAAFAVAMLFATIGFTTTIYAFQYRIYYAQWHDPVFTITWIIQFVFTTGGAVFQFVVTGMRLYFPIGFVALLAASLWFALRRR